MAGPCNCASNRRQIAHNWWLLLVTLIVRLDFLNISSIGVEESDEISSEARSQGITAQNCFKLAQKTEGINNVGDIFEFALNILLEHGLDVRDLNVEFNEITVKSVFLVVEETVVLALELGDVSIEFNVEISDVETML
jgi:hypothetical protein